MNDKLKEVVNRSQKHSDYIKEKLSDKEWKKLYLDESFDEFQTTADLKELLMSLEKVVKAEGDIAKFSRKIGVDRSNLSDILKGKKIPRLDTVGKILGGLGYRLKLEETA